MAFDQVCKKVESMALRDEDEFKTTYTDCQVRIGYYYRNVLPYIYIERLPLQRNMEHIYERLQDAYSRRDQLWVGVQQDVDQCSERLSKTQCRISVDMHIPLQPSVPGMRLKLCRLKSNVLSLLLRRRVRTLRRTRRRLPNRRCLRDS